MNKDGIAIAFELISEELERIADEIADQGSLAFKERRYDDAQRLSGTGKNLLSFVEKVKNLLEEWQAGFDVNVRRKISINKIRKPQTKSQKTRLRVKFNNGKAIEEYFAADTFSFTIKEIGLSKVEPLRLTVRGVPLVGMQRSRDYNQRQIDGKFICVHSSTEEKKEMLEKIAERLGVGFKVEIVK